MTTVPLWKTLLAVWKPGGKVKLTCDECFAILEYLADRAIAGADADHILEIAHAHIEKCPNCYADHARRLRELEAELSGLGGGGGDQAP